MLAPKISKGQIAKVKMLTFMRGHMLVAYAIMLFGLPLTLMTLVCAVSTVTILPLSLLLGWL